MTPKSILIIFIVTGLSSFTVFGQNAGINIESPQSPLHVVSAPGQSLGNAEAVLNVEYTGPLAGDAFGVFSKCAPADGWGVGGVFIGGRYGLQGVVQQPGGGDDYIGVVGVVDGGSNDNYGIYGSAHGSGNNYAGYFGNGDVVITNNLGIGLSHPLYPIDMSGIQSVARLTSTAAGNGSVLDLKNLTENPAFLGAINFTHAGGTHGQIAYMGNNQLTFRVNNAERMRINANGYLGVGQNLPQSPLHVNQPSGTTLIGGQSVSYIEYTGTNANDVIGLRVKCKPADYYGIGGEFEGGYIGVKGKTTGSAGGDYFGVWGESVVTSGSGKTYGIYASAAGAGLNYAGYFNNGNVYVTNRLGLGRDPGTNKLEVEGNASKSSAGDWLANSDERLKKNIQPLDPTDMIEKLLALKGITYEWNDDKTGSERPEGIHYGFSAQNIREVFPTLVEVDAKGYLQTAYGTYDAMMVEAIRYLHAENEMLKSELKEIRDMLAQVADR